MEVQVSDLRSQTVEQGAEIQPGVEGDRLPAALGLLGSGPNADAVRLLASIGTLPQIQAPQRLPATHGTVILAW